MKRKFCHGSNTLPTLCIVIHRKSASCTHVSGLLHALVALSPSEFIPPERVGGSQDSSDDDLPITSYKCQWVQPKKRKESNTKMADANFEKHVYGRERKHFMHSIEDFDPRPPENIGTVAERLAGFLARMQGKGLGVSLLLDPSLERRLYVKCCIRKSTPLTVKRGASAESVSS